MHYVETLPGAALRSRIRCYWFLTGTETTTPPAPALPDGSPELVLNFGDPIEARSPDGASVTQPRATFVGQITGPFVVVPVGRLDVMGVRFEAHGASGWVDQAEWLRDRWIDAAAIRTLRTDRLLEQLAESRSVTERALVLDRYFGAILPNGSRRSDRPVERAVALIRRSGGATPLDRVMATLDVSARQLQRAFAAEAGLSPKLFLRICRFQRVFAAWQRSPGNWARTAVECGYYDQSHLVRDFRQFSGGAPAQFIETGPEFSRLFTALRPRSIGQRF
jgi:AraC-like DNA-binding protein